MIARPLPFAVVLLFASLVLPLTGTPPARAGGLGLPSNRAGVGFGNLPEFAGVRMNLQDDGVRRVTGINITVWTPLVELGKRGDQHEVANGTYHGLGLNLVGARGEEMAGVHLGLVGLDAQRRAAGIMIGGLGVGAGELVGFGFGGLGAGCETLTGVAIGGLGVGGERMSGVAIGGLGVGGERLRGLFAAGLGVGARSLHGLAAAAAVGSRELHGAALAVAYQRTERLYGVATGVYNRADRAEGLMLGVFNSVRTLRGVQIGVLNHVADGPAAARWLPLVNARF